MEDHAVKKGPTLWNGDLLVGKGRTGSEKKEKQG